MQHLYDDQQLDEERSSQITSASSASGSAVGAKRKKTIVSLASGVSSTTSVKGAVTRVSLVSGVAVSTQLYFRLPKVVLSDIEFNRFEIELRAIWKADFPSDKCSNIELLAKVQAYTFCSIRHSSTVDRFGNPASRRTVLRAPRGDQFHTAVETDEIGSYALIYSILDFCERTYCFVRWVTSTYPGCRNPPTASSICGSNFKKLKITEAFSVINVLQIKAVVCVIPVFSQPGFIWLNPQPLGTVLRAYTQQETEVELQTHSD